MSVTRHAETHTDPVRTGWRCSTAAWFALETRKLNVPQGKCVLVTYTTKLNIPTQRARQTEKERERERDTDRQTDRGRQRDTEIRERQREMETERRELKLKLKTLTLKDSSSVRSIWTSLTASPGKQSKRS